MLKQTGTHSGRRGGRVSDVKDISRPGAIITVRHGRPDADRTLVLDRQGYRDWWRAYGEAGLAAGQTPPPELVEAAKGATRIFSSTLPRSLETAEAVAMGRAVEVDPVFVEAHLPPPAWPWRLKPGPWGVVARIAWWFGHAGSGETRGEAKQRAEKAAARLDEAARAGDTVLLTAHGWFNRMLRPPLQRRGWRCVYNGGDKYWSHRRLVLKP